MKIIKFRHVTESEWLSLSAEKRMPDTRYTIYSNDRKKVLYEWMGSRVTENFYSKDEIDDKLEKLEVNGGYL